MHDQPIHPFLEEMGRRLHVEGVPEAKIGPIVEEVHCHLVEAMDAALIATPEDARQVVQQFGKAETLAKTLAAEYHRAAKRPFLWPAIIVFVVWLTFMVMEQPYHVFSKSLDTYIIIAAPIALFYLGFRARRPLIGQFVALTAALLVGQTTWLVRTSFPVANFAGGRPSYYQSVYRWELKSTLAQFQNSIQQEKDTHSKVLAGQKAFADLKPRPIPGFLRYGRYYMLPEGLRESGFGVSLAGRYQGLVAPTLKEAVQDWNDHKLGSRIPGAPNQTEAEWVLSLMPGNIADDQRCIDYLGWIQTQPIAFQLPLDFQMAKQQVLFLAIPGAITANLGWLLWFLIRGFGRLNRWVTYEPDRLAT